MSYADFARLLSVVVVLLYFVLLLVATRRARFRDRRAMVRTEAIAVHARFLEGPTLTVLFLAALGTALAASVIGHSDYTLAAGLVIAALRGGLFVLGVWLAAFYWRERETWR